MQKKPGAGNDYDRILKENFILELLEVFKIVLGIEDCELDTEIKLPGGKIQSTTEREPDFVRAMRRQNGEKFILHIEFQVTDDREMLYRIQEYHGLLHRKVKVPIRHYVIYLGDKTPKMENKLPVETVFTGFELINLREYNSRRLLESQIPEEIILAVLGNTGDEKPGDVIKAILNKLTAILPDSIKLSKYIHQLTVLSRLRNLQEETIKQAETMALTININDDILYKKGMQKGMEKGMEKDKMEVTCRLLKKKFSLEEIQEIVDLPLETIRELMKKDNTGEA